MERVGRQLDDLGTVEDLASVVLKSGIEERKDDDLSCPPFFPLFLLEKG